MNHRPERVGKLIREELGKIILKELEFDGALVTITEVDVDRHLAAARVLVSVIPSSAEEQALAVMQKAAGQLQHALMKRIQIKPMPRIQFEIDRGPRHAAEVEKVFLRETPMPLEESEFRPESQDRKIDSQRTSSPDDFRGQRGNRTPE